MKPMKAFIDFDILKRKSVTLMGSLSLNVDSNST